MKTKLIFSTETKKLDCWTDMPFIPRQNEYFNLKDILSEKELFDIKDTAHNWSGNKGHIQSVEYRHDDNDFYPEIIIWCED